MKAEWKGWIITNNNTPVGVDACNIIEHGKCNSRTGFIEVFHVREVAKYHLRTGEKILRVKVKAIEK